jgi:hypothetical protein
LDYAVAQWSVKIGVFAGINPIKHRGRKAVNLNFNLSLAAVRRPSHRTGKIGVLGPEQYLMVPANHPAGAASNGAACDVLFILGE